jgi:serine/threonine protein kinase/Tol biopolymer transport system component
MKDLFERAVSLAPADRNVFLAEACGGDSELRADIEGLLEHHRSTTFLDQGPSQLLGSLISRDVEGITFQIGEMIAGRFKIARFIGRGGMGEVYEAEDLELGVRIALKTLRPEISSNPEALNRFKQEVQLARRVTHPNVCRMFDIARGRTNREAVTSPTDHVFLTMELLEGEPLSKRLRRTGRMGIEEAWPIIRQMGEALQSAHEAGVIHRDFKPSNVLLVPTQVSGANEIRAVVTDFGLARAASSVLSAGAEHALDSLSLSNLLGTPAYMAPEQIEGRPATAASDIYAFGLVLYEMVTGVRPFDGPTPISAIEKRLTQPPPAPRALTPALSPTWESVILRCLEPEPVNRFGTIREAVNALAGRETSVRRLAPWPYVAAGVLSASLLMTGLLTWINRNNRETSTAGHLEYTRLTDFADSVVYPALSPDGRMLAMIRGDADLPATGDVYVKVLPAGRTIQLTHDDRLKAKPVFSPDSSRIAFTSGAGWDWRTWSMPVLGGEPLELLPNASGLTWVGSHQVMFSEMGDHMSMKIVTAGENRSNERDVYRPPPGGMAHFSSLSPDSKWVLVVEMDSDGWIPCRLVSFSGGDAGKQVGPIPSQCTDAEWSPDGHWMYFSANVGGGYHLWRQRFPSGTAEQITFGATEENGIAVAPDGRSLITAVGSEQSTIWLHTPKGERQISSEAFAYQPSFSRDGKTIYYLTRDDPSNRSGTLRSIDLTSDRKEELLPGIPIRRYAVSPDSRTVVFTRAGNENSGIWISPLDKRASPRQLIRSQADMPLFSRTGEVFFIGYEGQARHIFRINQDGRGLQKLIAEQVGALVSISPDGRWIVAATDVDESQTRQSVIAYSLQGAYARVLYRKSGIGSLDTQSSPYISWSADQKAIYFARSSDQIKTIVVPVSPSEAFPRFSGNQLDDDRLLSKISGARVLERTAVFPGPKIGVYAISRTTMQRNLYRIGLPSP